MHTHVANNKFANFEFLWEGNNKHVELAENTNTTKREFLLLRGSHIHRIRACCKARKMYEGKKQFCRYKKSNHIY